MQGIDAIIMRTMLNGRTVYILYLIYHCVRMRISIPLCRNRKVLKISVDNFAFKDCHVNLGFKYIPWWLGEKILNMVMVAQGCMASVVLRPVSAHVAMHTFEHYCRTGCLCLCCVHGCAAETLKAPCRRACLAILLAYSRCLQDGRCVGTALIW